ncbi:response regulator [Methanolobus halotolerans]|uniref:Two-component system response regulator n=1 Tax=Methanolobus halotolerans TaxID=2052935 RepID=A0A4E0PWD6_9EURY|nr:response regulator [Methanolobus halotolerans]TGC06502.1 two-component system response regulator [Methanolobus halotolerans]
MANILVVEDNPLHLELLISILEIKGYEVEGVGDGEKALHSVKISNFDLILLDMHLPGMDGLEVLKRLKQNPLTRYIPVIAVTACAMKGDKEAIIGAGCVDYVSKPFEISNILYSTELIFSNLIAH